MTLPHLTSRFLSLFTLRDPRICAIRTARVDRGSKYISSRGGRILSHPLLELIFPALVVCRRKPEPRLQPRKTEGLKKLLQAIVGNALLEMRRVS